MKKVLLVEDQEDYAKLVTEYLRPTEVVRTTTVEEAIQLLPPTAPDVVLLDLHVPPHTGMSALRKLMEAKPSPPVVVLTAQDNYLDLEGECLLLGASEVLSKLDIDRRFLIRALSRVEARYLYRLQHDVSEAVLGRLDGIQTVLLALVEAQAQTQVEMHDGLGSIYESIKDPACRFLGDAEPTEELDVIQLKGKRPEPPPAPPEPAPREPGALRVLWETAPAPVRTTLSIFILVTGFGVAMALVNWGLDRIGAETVETPRVTSPVENPL